MNELKPPLGLKPKQIHEEQRVAEILKAIYRYKISKKSVPKEWIDELIILTR